MIPPHIVVWIYSILLLLAAVLAYGIWTGSLNATTAATLLSGVLSGGLAGVMLRRGETARDDEEKDPTP